MKTCLPFLVAMLIGCLTVEIQASAHDLRNPLALTSNVLSAEIDSDIKSFGLIPLVGKSEHWSICQSLESLDNESVADEGKQLKPLLMREVCKLPGFDYSSSRGGYPQKRRKKSKLLRDMERIVREMNRKDGRSERTAFPIQVKTGSSLVLPKRPGKVLFVQFTIPTHSKIEVELSGPFFSRPQNIKLRTVDTPSNVNIPITSLMPVGSSLTDYRMSFELSPADYVFSFEMDSKPSTLHTANAQESYRLVISNVVDLTEPLLLLRGSQTTVRLDAISRTATRRIFVEKRALVSFVVTKAPQFEDSKSSVRVNLKTFDHETVEPVESNEREHKRHNASFILSPGIYYIEVLASSNISPLSEPLDEEITLSIEEVFYDELPESMRALQVWLNDVGLDKLLEIEEFFEIGNPTRGLPRANLRLARFAAKAARYKVSEETKLPREWEKMLEEQIANGNAVVWPPQLREVDRPSLIVSFRSKKDRHEFEASETAFERIHKLGLWDRLLQKISSLEGVSARRIVVNVLIPCSAGLVFLGPDYLAGRNGRECTSASASASLIVTANTSSAGTSTLNSSPRSLSDTVPSFLSSFVGTNTDQLEFLTTEVDFIEVIVRGIRGQVIQGGPDWERLQITFAVTGGNGRRPPILRVSVDGRIASGLGNYPTDSQFTRDMEPKHSMNLTEFSKKLANALRDRMLQQ